MRRHRHRNARRARQTFAALVIAPVAVIGLGASPAAAHPLGNFSVNHLNTLTFTADQIMNDVVIDFAEIPTAQDRPTVDADGNGEVARAELAAHGAAECAAFVAAGNLTIDGVVVALDVETSSYVYESGQAGLETSRLECRLVADIERGPTATADAPPLSVKFSDGYRSGRVGWNEINAVGQGTSIVDSPVAASSVTDGLRSYPIELLDSPLDVRSALFEIIVDTGAPDENITAAAGAIGSDDLNDNARSSSDSLVASRPGALGGFVDGVQDRFENMIGQRDLTVGVGLLAIGLALLLGASHALLPGHGKTVMAAYIAGRQGSVRDAVLVGFTVTATHTGGVLLLGLGLTISTSLAGETVLGWLGVISGGLVAALGLALLISAVRHRGAGPALFGHDHSHGPHGHTHRSHGDGHANPLDHANPLMTLAAEARVGLDEETATIAMDGDLLERVRTERRHGHPHELEHDEHHDHNHDHNHNHNHHHDHDHERQVSRRGLVGMGIAGGLVPSPSALIVLLSAIALGRTWFGIVLVVGYGIGMAATLTAAGILLVKVRDRFADRMSRAGGAAGTFARRWGRAIPYVTATLVLIVGVGLAVRSVSTL